MRDEDFSDGDEATEQPADMNTNDKAYRSAVITVRNICFFMHIAGIVAT